MKSLDPPFQKVDLGKIWLHLLKRWIFKGGYIYMLGDFSEFQSSIYKSLISVSSIVLIVGMFTTGEVSMNCYITAYAALAISIILILVQLLNNIQTKSQGASSIGTTALNLLPFLIMLSVISTQIYFNTKYRSIIIEGKVSSGFNTFSNIVTILLLIQTYLIYSAVNSKTFQEKGIPTVTSSTLLLLAVLSGISTNIIRTILKYFTTDGFDPIIKI